MKKSRAVGRRAHSGKAGPVTIALLVCTCVPLAQASVSASTLTGGIVGSVVDPDGRAVVDAAVEALAVGADGTLTTTTDSEGL